MSNNISIQEGNKLIAEFMGATVNEKWTDKLTYFYQKGNTPTLHSSYNWAVDEMQYHSDWAWLMPVVEKIGTCRYPEYWTNGKPEDANEFDDCAYLRTFGMRDEAGNYMVRFNASILIKADTLIKATWLAVIDFITPF